MSIDFDRMSAVEMKRRIIKKEISPVEITKRALQAAEDTQKTLNAFCVLMPETALAAATAAEDSVMRGQPLGLLHGIPFSVKDLIAVKDVTYASGSKTMAKNIATVDAPSVERAKAAGGILIGKTTTSEFGCKPVGDNLLTGITRSPWNPSKTPGGSSAGAAASVAAGITPFALGTDGGGSIRVPCSFSGLFGIKGHFGRVPVWPTSTTPTLAHVGPIARNVQDGALLFSAIAGYVSNWKTFFTNNGLHGSADQIDLAARGTAWGDAVGLALSNNLGPLNAQTINFLEDAAQGTAVYSASLSSQPNHAAFQGAATASVASAANDVQLTGVATHIDHIVM